MSVTFYVATSNRGKLRDFEAVAEECSTQALFVPLPGLRDITPPPEDGATFEENARSKAIAYSLHAAGSIVLADDSGLEVDALDGAPGVRSARYAADGGFPQCLLDSLGVEECNNRLLLQNMLHVPARQRTARYRCVLAAARDGQCIAAAKGTVEGMILNAPRGNAGFGYDPIFYLPQVRQTMAEISLQQKFQSSHRGQALRALLDRYTLVRNASQQGPGPGNN